MDSIKWIPAGVRLGMSVTKVEVVEDTEDLEALAKERPAQCPDQLVVSVPVGPGPFRAGVTLVFPGEGDVVRNELDGSSERGTTGFQLVMDGSESIKVIIKPNVK